LIFLELKKQLTT